MRLQSLSSLFLAISLVSARHQDEPKANCWKQLAPIKNGPRQEHGVVATNNSIYVIGGTKMGSGGRGQENSVEVYNIATNTWSDIPPLPIQIHHANVASVGGKIYVLGGLDGFVPTRKTLGNIYRYDPAVGKWEELGQMPLGTERGSAAVAVNENIIYLAGGLQPRMGDSDYGKNVADLVSSYDTVSRNWKDLPKIPERRDHVGEQLLTIHSTSLEAASEILLASKAQSLRLNWGLQSGRLWPVCQLREEGCQPESSEPKSIRSAGREIHRPPQRYIQTSSRMTPRQTGGRKRANMRQPRHGTGAVSVGDVIYIPGGGLSGGGGAKQ